MIADSLGCDDQPVRHVIHRFNTHGVAVLTPGSSAPHRTPPAVFTPARRAQLRAAAPEPAHLWQADQRLDPRLAAEVAYAEGITPRQVSGETIRTALAQLKVRWQRAKHWITSPDPAYARKKQRDRLIHLAARHPDWVLGCADAVWWSRTAQPDLHSWAAPADQLRLEEKAVAKDDADPTALATACLRHGRCCRAACRRSRALVHNQAAFSGIDRWMSCSQP